MECPKQAKSVILLDFSRVFSTQISSGMSIPYRKHTSATPGIILSYRNIPRLNIDLFLPPLIRIGSGHSRPAVRPQWQWSNGPVAVAQWCNGHSSQSAGRPDSRPAGHRSTSARSQCGLGGSIWVPNKIETPICKGPDPPEKHIVFYCKFTKSGAKRLN